MKQLTLAAITIALATCPVFALDIKVTPGSLASDYAQLRHTKDASLKVSGTADVRDLILLRDISPDVKSIDLSDLDIKAYTFTSGDYMGRTAFEAGELPPYILSGSRISSIKLPASLRIIGESAFVASHIETVDFPESLVKIGDYAFANASKLKSATFKKNLTIGTGVFKDCKALKSVNIDYSITEIPASMFDGCTSFVTDVPQTVKKIGPFAYRGTALDSVSLVSAEIVGDYAFADMPKLNSLIMEANRDIEFGKGAFFNDVALESIPTFNTDLSSSIFSYVPGIMPGYIQSENIGPAAFANNQTLDSIRLGASVKYIASNAFRNDTRLKLIDASLLKNNIPEVENDAFYGLLNDEGRYDIDLNVEPEYTEQWQQHPVWGLFNIGKFTVGIDDMVADVNTRINISRISDGIKVESTHNIDYVGIFSLNGMVLHESTPGVADFAWDNLPGSEVVVVKVISGGLEKISKLK